MYLKLGFNKRMLCLINTMDLLTSFYTWCNAMNRITLTASNVLMRHLISVRIPHIFILLALQSKVYVSGRLTAGSKSRSAHGCSFLPFVVQGVSSCTPGLIFFLSNGTTCPCGLRGPPSWAWQKCNRLLSLGRPWGAVTLSRWCEWWYRRM